MSYYGIVSSDQVCLRFHRAIELIGGRWNGPILYAVLDGHRRYAEIKVAVTGLSDTMLSHRLKELETEGLVTREVMPTFPVSVEYHPTAKAKELVPIMQAIGVWAHRWIDRAESPKKEADLSPNSHLASVQI